MGASALVTEPPTVDRAASVATRVLFDPSANFSRYRSYSWIFAHVPRSVHPLIFQRLKASIDRALRARSFMQTRNGNFAIAFTLGPRDRVDATDFGPYGANYPGWGGGSRTGWAPLYDDADILRVAKGTLAVDIYDAATRRPVWHAFADREVGSPRIRQEVLDHVVDTLLAAFPPRSAYSAE